jgi:thioredoxin-related protein
MRLFALLLLILIAAPAHSAELVMFEQKSCVWCQRFDRDIAPAYDKTSEGKRAPLRRLDISQPVPTDLAFIRRERFTPVFVLIDQGREIGRIRGYPGDTFFWGLLANLIERLERGETAPAEPLTSPPRGVTFGE